ncbi:MAG: UTP--glucose-1-phosphate uridylyltransferase [Patescibacteria group bacterium]
MKKITKAVIPAAGLGTRFLPQTKAMPKEMLPIIDKPVIQLVVEELVAVGVTDIIIVTGPQKRAIEDHFDRSLELEDSLRAKGKTAEAEMIASIADLANFIYVRQKGLPLGNARPVLNAMHLLGDEPFFVLFPDDFFSTDNASSCQQMIDAYNEHDCPVLSLTEPPKADLEKYGVIKPKREPTEDVYEIEEVVEKPRLGSAPSGVATVGGYILTPDFLPYLESVEQDQKGEISIPNAMADYLSDNHKVVGKLIDGRYMDCGSKQGYLDAVVDAAKKMGMDISV